MTDASFTDFDTFVHTQENKSLLRFITCGSVDDGKSTLIGRLLYETKLLFDDQLDTLERDSKKVGTQGGALDFALLVDGLAAEREQGITIDVAYRFFTTQKRKFIVADTPGHEQYTRNMATGASTADLAVLLVDARKGLSRQTKRHSLLVSMLGIKHIVVAVNKMDLMGWSQDTFDSIMEEYRTFSATLGFETLKGIPMSAISGDNILEASPHTPWYSGKTLVDHLETIEITSTAVTNPFRMPVQWVNRPNLDFRGFAGLITDGVVRVGDPMMSSPSGLSSVVEKIILFDKELPVAVAGQSVTITLTDEIDVSRGDVLSNPKQPPHIAESLKARLFWMAPEALEVGRSYLLKLGTRTVTATVERVKGRVDLENLTLHASTMLSMNEIGDVLLRCDRPLVFDAYTQSRDMGGFILIDRDNFDTVGMGLCLEARDTAAIGAKPWHLLIGNKTYSSWSLRSWLALKVAGLAFDETVIPLRREDTSARIAPYSNSSKVPVLIDGSTTVHDSLAILEYAAEIKPSLWPSERRARAVARSLCAEMHSGFSALRGHCPMNTRRKPTPHPEGLPEDVLKDITRIGQIWRETRSEFGRNGAFLFGTFTNADAMFAPVAVRFMGYDLPRDSLMQEYIDALYALPAFQEWVQAAAKETDVIEAYER
jgi:sulfate adenylyltransferase large subunit